MDERLVRRFWAKVEKSPDCWTWTGARRDGYGMISLGGRGAGNVAAHRLSYLMHYGRDPGDLYVLHRCDNPSCVNPDHLYLGTHEQNMADLRKRGRWGGVRKLTDSDVSNIIARGREGEAVKQIHHDYPQVSRDYIRKIIEGIYVHKLVG